MRVIICDDHAIVREGIRLMLSSDPMVEVVGEAGDGSELLDMLGDTETDVVILDLKMEGTGGLEVLEQLRDVEEAPPVVVLTMHDDESYLRRAVELGARGYLLKRSGAAELARALRAVAGGGSHIDPHLTTTLVSLATSDIQRPEPDPGAVRLLRLLAAGLDTDEIMLRTGWSKSTTKSRIRSLYRTLGVSRRADAVAAGLRRRLVD